MLMSRCPLCNGRVLRHSVKLECDCCTNSIHIQCLPVDKDEYNVIVKRNHGWTCPHWCGILYAFNGIDDDHCFASALYELISDIPLSMDTISNLIFNPLMLNDKSNIPLFETDPDIHFYNELSIIYNENSNYYFEDQFNHLLSRIECSQNLSFLHANIRSLKANRVMFESFIDDLQRKFSIIGLTETWLTPVCADLHTLPGYCHVYRCRKDRRVVVYRYL